jgi:hypothetical protein
MKLYKIFRRPQTQRRNSSSSWCTASPELLEQFDKKVKEAVEAAKEGSKLKKLLLRGLGSGELKSSLEGQFFG